MTIQQAVEGLFLGYLVLSLSDLAVAAIRRYRARRAQKEKQHDSGSANTN